MFKKLRIKFTFLVFLISLITLLTIDISLNIGVRIRSRTRLEDQVTMILKNGNDKFSKNDFMNRYIIIIKSDDNYTIHHDRGFGMDESNILNYGKEIFNLNSDKGYYSNFYYQIYENKLIMIDAKSEIDSSYIVFLISSIVSSAALAFITLSAFIFSNYVIKPYEQLYKSQRRFLTDASHELKTPLSIIQADLDVLESQNLNNKWIESASKQTERMKKLILEMITLNKLEELSTNYPKDKFDISSSMLEVIDNYEGMKFEKNVTFKYEIPENINIIANQELCIKLFSVLLDNSFKYVNENGYISVVLKDNHKKVVLTVENSANDLDEEKIQHCFDRFYTFDSSRAKTKSGFGIGLSIAKAIVEEHGGEIKAYTINDKTAIRFEIILKK